MQKGSDQAGTGYCGGQAGRHPVAWPAGETPSAPFSKAQLRALFAPWRTAHLASVSSPLWKRLGPEFGLPSLELSVSVETRPWSGFAETPAQGSPGISPGSKNRMVAGCLGWLCISSEVGLQLIKSECEHHRDLCLSFFFLKLVFLGVVQLLSHLQLFVTPWTVACQDDLSPTISWSLLKLMSIESVMPSKHLILCHTLLLLPSVFPSTRVFSQQWGLF